MEQTPNIIMQCPKCRREFPLDDTYCESCSAMLEPVEVECQETVAGTAESKNIPPPPPPDNDDKFEDIKIDSLKTEIENKFILTLTHETKHLKARLAKKQRSLSGMQTAGSSTENQNFAAQFSRTETEISDIRKRIANIESILDNLRKKIEADIGNLTSKLQGMTPPGFFSLMDSRSRYYRMLTSELRTKKTLMDIIQGKVSPSFFRLKSTSLTSLLITASLVLLVALPVSLYLFNRAASSDKVETAGAQITEKEILDLLEDIRNANLRKDVSLWESRYAKSYLELEGKREGLLEQWRNFDYISLKYRTENLQHRPDAAGAAIIWDIELRSRQTGEAKTISQRLDADFIREDGRLKIRSVKKAER